MDTASTPSGSTRRTAGPTAAAVRPKPRERVIDAASRLFYTKGMHAVSVDELSHEAQVSKRSLYAYFANKDEIAAATMRERGPQLAALAIPAGDEGTPRQRILGVFALLREHGAGPDFHGCPLVSMASELRDPSHPASQLAKQQKIGLQDYFEQQARLAGAVDPTSLAIQLTMLFDGANAYLVVRDEPLPDAADAAVLALLTAHGVG
ncbi:TetR/AcrR family transcriptional regulator [Compostimonas suwonensis]|uniref:AcrR family transcriptional regulator n=1 Tax=Compostimonas suwonensis TaxID=1048394 RepID=A0A2M9BW47_9MICO|nr:TetR/AcrR family transcriptional regulator [Compostimonas suwonensis]PJJ62144.1 AcrR family transcriptional regulator [Compostimonas suwonensis]